MVVTIVANGVEHHVEVTEEQIDALLGTEALNRTAYDRVSQGNDFYCSSRCGDVATEPDERDNLSDRKYDVANYWNNKTAATNDIRADVLMRKLRRYSMMHGGYGMPDEHWTYKFNRANSTVFISNSANDFPIIGQITFFSWDDARNALVMYRDDIEWYFREYLPSKEV